MPKVFIPKSIRPLVGDQEVVAADGGRVRDIIDDLERRFPGFKDRLCESGQLRPGLTVAVDGSVAALGMLQSVRPDAEIHFLPALGGG